MGPTKDIVIFFIFLLLKLCQLTGAAPATATSSLNVAVATPAPLIIPPSQSWDGNDGPWSSFFLRVGTPAQSLRVLVSTASNQPLVVLAEGCFITDPTDCTSSRGSIFTPNASSTWIQNGDSSNGIFSLAIVTNLGIRANALYGNDTVALSLLGDAPPSLPGQNVGGIASKDFFMGVFGLNPAATNFSTFNDPVPSYMSNLKLQGSIPSLSYGYTAGNQYRFNGILASLTLGGYDASLIEPNNLTVDFDSNGELDLIINVNAITMSSGFGNTTLNSSSFPAFIDSTTPYLWLPEEVCNAFEEAFDLVYDNSSGLYLVNDTLHTQLLARNASITFSLTNATAKTFVNIVLPYEAFDLTASWPLVQNTSRYFPLKRAANNTQTTLGRAFLQEAYLIADYERSSFSIHQRSWNIDAAQDLVAILPPGDVQGAASQHHKSTPVAAIVAGSICGTALVTLTIGLAILIRQRARRLAALQVTTWKFEAPTITPAHSVSYPGSSVFHPKPELDGVHTQQRSPEPECHEIEARPRFDSDVSKMFVEMNARNVTAVEGVYEMEANERVGSPVEVLLQEAIEEMLEQEMEELRKKNGGTRREIPAPRTPQIEIPIERENLALDVVSPLSPDDEDDFTGRAELNGR